MIIIIIITELVVLHLYSLEADSETRNIHRKMMH